MLFVELCPFEWQPEVMIRHDSVFETNDFETARFEREPGWKPCACATGSDAAAAAAATRRRGTGPRRPRGGGLRLGRTRAGQRGQGRGRVATARRARSALWRT